MKKVCRTFLREFQTVIKTDYTCTHDITQCPKKCSNLQLNFGALIIQAETILMVLIVGIVRHALHGFQYCI